MNAWKLTTQQADDILKVSQPFVIERLEKGEIRLGSSAPTAGSV